MPVAAAAKLVDREADVNIAKLIAIVESSTQFLSKLRAVRGLGLADWCIGAGAVRNLVWDHLHGHASPSALADVDVAFFDEKDLSGERDHRLQGVLAHTNPGVPWEVTNQAAVHLWFASHFGHPVEPLRSLYEAIGSWPEFSTCVGVRLDSQDHVHVIAPHGLDDLFAMKIRRNPARVSVETYRERCATKQYQKRWPDAVVIPA